MAGGKRTSLATLGVSKVEPVPGKNDPTLVQLPIGTVIPTPLNPRTDFGTVESLGELGDSMRRRQLQPVVVVSRVSYLKLWPEHEEQVSGATYVIANGERRYRAAKQVDLGTIEAVIREEVAESRADFLDAVLSENLDRKNFDPIEEAHAVDLMAVECGSATAAAGRYGRSEGWVSQRRKLLKLSLEVQALVRTGEIPVREARELAGLPAVDQLGAWREREEERQRKAELPRAPRQRKEVAPPSPPQQRKEVAPPPPAAPVPDPAPVPEPEPAAPRPVFTAVKTNEGAGDEPAPDGESKPAIFTAVKTGPQPAPVATVGRTATVPIDDDRRALEVLQATMSREVFGRFLARAAQFHQDVAALEA